MPFQLRVLWARTKDAWRALPARARQGARVALWFSVLVLLLAAWVVPALLRRRRATGPDALLPTDLEQDMRAVRERLAAANAEAALEITAARTREVLVNEELSAIQSMSDARARRRALIAMRARIARREDVTR